MNWDGLHSTGFPNWSFGNKEFQPLQHSSGGKDGYANRKGAVGKLELPGILTEQWGQIFSGQSLKMFVFFLTSYWIMLFKVYNLDHY